MLKNIAILSTVLMFVMGAGVQGNAADLNKVGIVDTQSIVENSTAFQQIRKQIDARAEEYKKKALKAEEKLKEKYQALEKQKSVLSEEAYAKKQEELAKQANEYNRSVYLERSALDKAYTEAVRKVENKMLDIIQKQAKSKDLSFVTQKMYTLYSKPDLDITATVLKTLNKKLSDVNVDFQNKETKK